MGLLLFLYIRPIPLEFIAFLCYGQFLNDWIFNFIHNYLCNEIRSDWLNCTKNLKQVFFLFPGPLIGTSIGGLILGLVFGGGAVYFFRKYKRKGDDMTMNILQDWSNQASKISCFVIIKKDFLTLCRCPSSPDVLLLHLHDVWNITRGLCNVFFVCDCVEITHVCMCNDSVILYQMTEKC